MADTPSQMLEALPKSFETRAALTAFLRTTFPDAAARDDAVAQTQGGRDPALERLAAIDPRAYSRTRNHLDGKVSRLSAYIRAGVLSLAEVRDAALERVADPEHAFKFVQELAWRDYWRRVYAEIGDEGVWQDREAYKTGFTPGDFTDELPPEIPDGETGLACMDGFAVELKETGYLHNHARMYVAAYVVHWRRVKWQEGARWFLIHLLDGDPASNNLSWQWVASTFSHKPYIFNRENLERHTGGRYCETCPHASAGTCPFDASYAELSARLFPHMPPEGQR